MHRSLLPRLAARSQATKCRRKRTQRSLKDRKLGKEPPDTALATRTFPTTPESPRGRAGAGFRVRELLLSLRSRSPAQETVTPAGPLLPANYESRLTSSGPERRQWRPATAAAHAGRPGPGARKLESTGRGCFQSFVCRLVPASGRSPRALRGHLELAGAQAARAGPLAAAQPHRLSGPDYLIEVLMVAVTGRSCS